MKYGDCFCDSKRVICKENGEPFSAKKLYKEVGENIRKIWIASYKITWNKT